MMFNFFKKEPVVVPTMKDVENRVSDWVALADHEMIRKVLVSLTGHKCNSTKEFDTEQHLIQFWSLRVFRHLNINRIDGTKFFNRVEKYLGLNI